MGNITKSTFNRSTSRITPEHGRAILKEEANRRELAKAEASIKADRLIREQLFTRPLSPRIIKIVQTINELKSTDKIEEEHFTVALPIIRQQILSGVSVGLFKQAAHVYDTNPSQIYYVGKYSLNVVENYARKKLLPLLKFDFPDHKIYVFMLNEIIEWNRKLTPEIWNSSKPIGEDLEYSERDLVHNRCVIVPRNKVYGIDPNDNSCPAMLAIPIAGKHVAGKVGSYQDGAGNTHEISLLLNHTHPVHQHKDSKQFSAKSANIIDIIDWKHRIKCYRDAYGYDSVLSSLLDSCSSDREYEADSDPEERQMGVLANKLADAMEKKHTGRQDLNAVDF